MNVDAHQTYTDVCRCMQTNPDEGRRTQSHTDEHKANCRRSLSTCPDIRRLFKDFCDALYIIFSLSLSSSFLPFVLFLLSLSSPLPQQSQCLMTHTLTDYLECEEDVVTQKGKKMTVCSQLLKNAHSCTYCAACLRNCSSFTMFLHVCLCVFVS